MPPDNDALGLYRYVGSLTHPVRYHSKTIFYPPLQLEQEVGWHLKMTGYFENTTYRKEHFHETF